MSASSSSECSLLRKHRPASLAPQTMGSSPVDEIQAELEQHEVRRLLERGTVWPVTTPRSRSRSSSTHIYDQESPAHPSQCQSIRPNFPTLPSWRSYLSDIPMASSSDDVARADIYSPAITSSDQLNMFNSGAMGTAISRDQWQPDDESALCTYPDCTTIFGKPHTLLGPRRHHCRKCGYLFCSTHASKRAPLVNSENQISKERVCDLCLKPSEPIVRHDSNQSCSSMGSSTYSGCITPNDPNSMSSSVLLTCSSSRRNSIDEDVSEPLAPIQPWMDKSGVISLYPLAAKGIKGGVAPAAGPLFAPSLSARRHARLRECERQNLRQKTFGKDNDFWVPGTWGYKRSEFDPSYNTSEEEPNAAGGLVVDGPIRYRAPGMRRTASAAPTVERNSVVGVSL